MKFTRDHLKHLNRLKPTRLIVQRQVGAKWSVTDEIDHGIGEAAKQISINPRNRIELALSPVD